VYVIKRKDEEKMLNLYNLTHIILLVLHRHSFFIFHFKLFAKIQRCDVRILILNERGTRD